MSAIDEVREKLYLLDEQLEQKLPGIAQGLREIHKQLAADPETVTLLSEEECAILVTGLVKHTRTEVATTALKKKATKAVSRMTIDDL